MQVEIAAPDAVHHGDALVPQTELAAALRAFGNLELVETLQRGDVDFTAQDGLRYV